MNHFPIIHTRACVHAHDAQVARHLQHNLDGFFDNENRWVGFGRLRVGVSGVSVLNTVPLAFDHEGPCGAWVPPSCIRPAHVCTDDERKLAFQELAVLGKAGQNDDWLTMKLLLQCEPSIVDSIMLDVAARYVLEDQLNVRRAGRVLSINLQRILAKTLGAESQCAAIVQRRYGGEVFTTALYQHMQIPFECDSLRQLTVFPVTAETKLEQRKYAESQYIQGCYITPYQRKCYLGIVLLSLFERLPADSVHALAKTCKLAANLYCHPMSYKVTKRFTAMDIPIRHLLSPHLLRLARGHWLAPVAQKQHFLSMIAATGPLD